MCLSVHRERGVGTSYGIGRVPSFRYGTLGLIGMDPSSTPEVLFDFGGKHNIKLSKLSFHARFY